MCPLRKKKKGKLKTKKPCEWHLKSFILRFFKLNIYLEKKKTSVTVDSCYQHQNFGATFSALKVGTTTSRMDDPCWWYFFRFQGGRGRLHQEFQVPKMDGFNKKNLMFFGYFGGGEIPVSISRIHTAYMGGSYLHFRYLKCLVVFLGGGGSKASVQTSRMRPTFPKKVWFIGTMGWSMLF